MRILFVSSLAYPDVKGGVDAVIFELLNRLKADHEVLHLRPRPWRDPAPEDVTTEGLRCLVMPLTVPYTSKGSLRDLLKGVLAFPVDMARLVKLLRASKVDVIHLHTLQYYQIYFAVLRWFGGPPYVITLHGSETGAYPERSWLGRWVWRQVLKGAEHVVAVSPSLLRRAADALPFCKKIQVIENATRIDPAELLNRTDLETALGRELPQRYVTILGALRPVKGQDRAIAAWPAVRARMPDLHLLIVGDGASREPYEAAIQDLGCGDVVHLIARQPRQIALSIAKSSLGLLMPSRSEGLPIALLEAAALELPLVCSAIPAFVDIVGESGNAVVVDPDDAEKLAEAIVGIAGDEALRRALGQSLAGTIRERFSADVMVRAYCEVYRASLKNGPREAH